MTRCIINKHHNGDTCMIQTIARTIDQQINHFSIYSRLFIQLQGMLVLCLALPLGASRQSRCICIEERMIQFRLDIDV